MEKIIFFGLVIPIMGYVLYLGGMAIMNGFNAKEANKVEKEEVEEQTKTTISTDNGSLGDELAKLNSLRESGVLTKEEFEKAKSKLLNT